MRSMLLLLPLLCALQWQAVAQEPAAPQATKKRPAASAKKPPTEARSEVKQLAEQLKLLSRFLYLYGRISQGLETADEQAKKGDLPEALLAKTKASKASVVSNITGIRAGLEKLEQTFHANPRLQRSYVKLLSASEAAARAEQLASTNRFDEAGRMLVGVAERLADLTLDVLAASETPPAKKKM